MVSIRPARHAACGQRAKPQRGRSSHMARPAPTRDVCRPGSGRTLGCGLVPSLTALVVLWLGASPAPAEQRAELLAWATAHSVSIQAPAPAAGPRYDARIVDDVEASLDEARAAASAS